jgi:hypothetical protein
MATKTCLIKPWKLLTHGSLISRKKLSLSSMQSSGADLADSPLILTPMQQLRLDYSVLSHVSTMHAPTSRARNSTLSPPQDLDGMRLLKVYTESHCINCLILRSKRKILKTNCFTWLWLTLLSRAPSEPNHKSAS